MKAYALLASIVTVGATAAYVDPPINLQASIPGSPQTGNMYITGRAKAGYFEAYSSAPSGIVYGGDFRTVSDQGRGVLGNASSPTGVTYGGLFQSASSSGRGIAGISSSLTGFAVGGFFTANSTDGKGVQGNSNATTGLNYGVYGRNLSAAGFGVYSEGNVGVTKGVAIGMGTATPPNRLRIQDDFEYSIEASMSVMNGTHQSFGLARTAFFAESGSGASSSADNLAIAAWAHNETGNCYGTYSQAGGAGVNYGVFGQAFSGTTNYSGYFPGLLYASSANAGIKAFMIDHPMDPANKVLMHSSIESDERMNLYRGEVVTDENGVATITLPNWMGALNEEFLYQLTVIDDQDSAGFTMAKVIQRIKLGKFKIRTSQPNTAVSWQVSGRRHDPTSNFYPLQVERMKNKDEKGRYYEPEAYGKDRTLGMGYLGSRSNAIGATPR